MVKPKLMPNVDELSTSPKVRPSFLIIGSQKCGTTALFDYLSTHPQIIPPREKEINYFACSRRYAQGETFYHSFFPEQASATGNQITFEASPNYMAGWDAPRRIYDYDPSLKLIAVLRDPVDRAHSAWQMYKRFYAKNKNWYFDWMAQCDATADFGAYVRRREAFGSEFAADIRQELEARSAGVPIEAPFLRHGFYAEQLRAFLEYFSLRQILVLESNQFKRNARATLHDVEEFLKLMRHDWSESLLQPVFVGGYENTLPADAIDLLKDIYRDRNQDLFGLVSKTFDWQC